MKKVLFVDDTLEILEGFKRYFKLKGSEWELYFASDAKTAFSICQEQQVDCVVSDIAMPGIDGAQLLEAISVKCPRTIRFAISGDQNSVATLAQSQKAHRFFGKPINLVELENAISRIFYLNDVMVHEDTDKVIASLSKTPAVPVVYFILVDEINNQSISIENICSIINGNIEIRNAVLQILNSSFFNNENIIYTIEEAISQYSVTIIKSLVLATELVRDFKIDSDTISFSQIIEHGMITANFSKAILESENATQEIIDTTFIAAVLHDLGEIIFAASFPERYKRAISISEASDRPLWQIEKDIIGTSHAEAGAYLLGLWGMPKPIVEAIAHHHKPEFASKESALILATLHIADIFSYELVPEFQHGGLEGTDGHFLKKLGISNKWSAWHTICVNKLNEIGYN